MGSLKRGEQNGNADIFVADDTLLPLHFIDVQIEMAEDDDNMDCRRRRLDGGYENWEPIIDTIKIYCFII